MAQHDIPVRMKFRQAIKFKLVLIMLMLLALLTTPFASASSADSSRKLIEKYKNALKFKPVQFTTYSETELPPYTDVLGLWKKDQKKDTKDLRLDISVGSFSGYSSDQQEKPVLQTGIGDSSESALVWPEAVNWIEWPVQVQESGFYNIEISYYALEGKRSSIDRSLQIDGKYPFNEAQRLSFYRQWADQEEPKQNKSGDDIRPKQVEVPRWTTVRITDNEGKFSEPFRFYLEKGAHTIRFELVKEPMALQHIALISPEQIPAYADVQQEYDAKGYKEVKDAFIKVQAEQADFKTDPTIRRETNSDPRVEPAAEGHLRLNVIGDYRWRKGGQYIDWSFEAPKDGLYQIALKAGQWWGDGLPGFRKIELDGKIPFQELEEYRFPYSSTWQMRTLGNEEGAFQFYLTKGEHHLRMTVQMGPLRDVIQSLSDTILKISDVNRKIIMVTGTKPDLNFRYELDKRIPDLMKDLKAIDQSLLFQTKLLNALAEDSTSVVQSLKQTRDLFGKMIDNPDSIPKVLDDMVNSQGQLGNWLLSLKESPLVLDYLVVASMDQKMPSARSNIFQRLVSTLKNFFHSFNKDYDSVGDSYDGNEGTTLNIWVGNGREWAELLKDLADEDFTPATGIRVNVNTIPAGQLSVGSVNTLLLAASSGRAPDVATSVDGTLPVEFALRGAAVDLRQFPDYAEVSKRFLPGALIPFHYNGGDYALPETQDFNMIVYRKDTLSELKLGIPDTWQELYKMLPILQRNGMNAFIPATFDPFLYQHGGSFYNETLTESGLNTPEAYSAFKEWTDLFTNYRIPIQADFFNRMRSNEMPIGIAGYQMYVQLSTAAPELAGRWGIAPAPGTLKDDGTVDRFAGGAVKGSVILKQSKKQKEAWEFLKWWMSKDTQLRYGQELESLLGVEARWNTANIDAFQELPWPKEDLLTFKEQWKWYREQPVVPGGYFTIRHITNAWNRVVLSAENPRESLEKAVKDINKELQAKQQEFGIKAQAN